jgi:hypothetical protein
LSCRSTEGIVNIGPGDTGVEELASEAPEIASPIECMEHTFDLKEDFSVIRISVEETKELVKIADFSGARKPSPIQQAQKLKPSPADIGPVLKPQLCETS